MPQKIAVAIIHGIGNDNPGFQDPNQPEKFTGGIAKRLKSQFSQLRGRNADGEAPELEIDAIYWAHILQKPQNDLWKRLEIEKLGWGDIRNFVFNSLADSVGYQITSATPPDDRAVYDGVHQCFADTLHRLAEKAGPNAPLCVIAHSMGAAIASNYIWDIQSGGVKAGSNKIEIHDNPLEKLETLTLLYTLGNQIPLWALRYNDFGTPVAVPSPNLSAHYPELEGEWVNYYDKDDVLGYPIKHMNNKYKEAVKEDREVNVGGLLSWTPLSHNGYWTNDRVTRPISQALFRLWQSVNLGT
ncbi:hypothetical protein [Leptolyngbya sp. FACHB-261]|uniref:hypothetical protein n=1 Tax=Leptolyngbya sp. FACHB-261 TaxID=2692806 RepID=UPI0016821F2F|nr:hypothetical protein [Leptolyngbya sp. FACHB-261]MBD2101774.1 hypothetical protein [Leptolyngbya sp. FACHB-261]